MRGNPHSPVLSAVDTVALDDMVKCVAWYDNEQGYTCRTADMREFMAQKGL
jgi:glyceraldehyde 3-phosphate dehydrogenase